MLPPKAAAHLLLRPPSHAGSPAAAPPMRCAYAAADRALLAALDAVTPPRGGSAPAAPTTPQLQR
jgi:hypothetical protein